jgi:hypothetical protein
MGTEELSVTLTESNCGASILRRLIDLPKTVYLTSFPLARETDNAIGIGASHLCRGTRSGAGKKLPEKLRLVVSARTEVVIREAKVRMQGPNVRWFLSSLTT